MTANTVKNAVEVVPTKDSQQENRFFFLSLVVIVWLAATLLWLRGHDHRETVRLPGKYTNLATQLSIAGDEIAMLQELEMVSVDPSLQELQQVDLAPFTSEPVTKAGKGCFVIAKQEVLLRLIKLETSESWQVHWRTTHSDHGHGSERQNEQNDLCTAASEWRPASVLSN